jgi:hypothetical protein
MMMKKLYFFLLAAVLSLASFAQKSDPDAKAVLDALLLSMPVFLIR